MLGDGEALGIMGPPSPSTLVPVAFWFWGRKLCYVVLGVFRLTWRSARGVTLLIPRQNAKWVGRGVPGPWCCCSSQGRAAGRFWWWCTIYWAWLSVKPRGMWVIVRVRVRLRVLPKERGSRGAEANKRLHKIKGRPPLLAGRN